MAKSPQVKEVINRRNKKFKFTRKAVYLSILPILEAGYKSVVRFIGRSDELPVGKVKSTLHGEWDKRDTSYMIHTTIGPLSYSERKYAKKVLLKTGKAPVALLKE